MSVSGVRVRTRATAAGPGTGPQNGFFPHTGRSIGLCTRRTSTMSGEEVENMEQSQLAEHISKVGPSQGPTGRGEGPRSHFAFPDSSLSYLYTQISIFYRTSPKHKLKIIKVSCVGDSVCLTCPSGYSPGRQRRLRPAGWSRARAGGSLGHPRLPSGCGFLL